jgi:hypothetical protein
VWQSDVSVPGPEGGGSTDGTLGEPLVWLAVVDPARLLAYLSFEQEYVIDPLFLTPEQIR